MSLHLKRLVACILLAFCLTSFSAAVAQSPADMQKLTSLFQQFQKQQASDEKAKAAETALELEAHGEKLMGASNPDIIGMGLVRAILLRDVGQYDKALQQARTTREKALNRLGRSHLIFGKSLITLGSIHRLKGEFDKAKQYYVEGIEILGGLGEAGQKDLAEGYANMADLLNAVNDPLAARVYNQKALDLNVKMFGADSIQVALLHNNLGMALMTLGDMDAAEEKLTRSLAVYEKIYGPDHAEIASSLNNVGMMYTKRGKYPEATAAYRRACKIADEKLERKDPWFAKIKGNLGQLLGELGEHEEAQALLLETIKLSNEMHGADHPSTATALHNLGSGQTDAQDYVNGRKHLTKAARAMLKTRGDRHPLTAGTFAYLGILETATKQKDAAIAAFTSARDIANQAAWEVLPGLSTNEQQNFMRQTFDWTLYTSLALAEQIPENQQVLQSTATWLANGKGIAEMALATARSNKTDQELQQVTLDQVRGALPDDAVLIDIARHDLIDYDARSLKKRLLDPHYVAWIIPPAGDVVRVDLGDAKMIDGLIDEAREEINNAGGAGGTIEQRGDAGAVKIVQAKLARLANVIWKPLAAKIDNKTRRLILSPDGQLWLVPWNALPVEQTDAGAEDDKVRWLVEQFAISTTASGRELVLGSQSDQPNKNKPAIFSNPDFDQSPSGKSSSYQRLFRKPPQPINPSAKRNRSVSLYNQEGRFKFRAKPLPGTDKEAKATTPSMKAWLGDEAPDNFRGPFALESVVKQLVRPRSVVFATHGFYAKADDDNSEADPLSSCGLLLAGCNDKTAEIQDDDGILTGKEIAALDLRSTELVVLSACETGTGKIENGNGVAGLRRAFHLAGAECVASTLWRIPDLETADLMTEFFATLAKDADKDDALRLAQVNRIKFLREQSGAAHPYYWAGFGISGR